MSRPVDALTVTTTCDCRIRFDWPDTDPAATFVRIRSTCQHQTWQLTITLMPAPKERA